MVEFNKLVTGKINAKAIKVLLQNLWNSLLKFTTVQEGRLTCVGKNILLLCNYEAYRFKLGYNSFLWKPPKVMSYPPEPHVGKAPAAVQKCLCVHCVLLSHALTTRQPRAGAAGDQCIIGPTLGYRSSSAQPVCILT